MQPDVYEKELEDSTNTNVCPECFDDNSIRYKINNIKVKKMNNYDKPLAQLRLTIEQNSDIEDIIHGCKKLIRAVEDTRETNADSMEEVINE